MRLKVCHSVVEQSMWNIMWHTTKLIWCFNLFKKKKKSQTMQGSNVDWPVKWQPVTSTHNIIAEAASNHLSPKYLNSSTWGSNPSQTRSGHATLFHLKAMVLELEVLISILSLNTRTRIAPVWIQGADISLAVPIFCSIERISSFVV